MDAPLRSRQTVGNRLAIATRLHSSSRFPFASIRRIVVIVVVVHIDRQSFLRRVWIVYRGQILFLAVVAGALLTFSGHRLIGVGFIAGLLLAGAAYSIIHSGKAGRSLSGELRRRQMSAARFQIISLLLAAVDFICAIVLTIVRWPPGALGQTIATIMILAFPGILVAGFVLAARRLHTGLLVPWLRRFHGRPMRGLSFPAVLGLACSGLATPITLQDDTFRQSSPVGTYRALHPRVILIEILGMVAAAVALILLLTSLLESVSLPLAGLIALPIVGLGYFVLSDRHRRSLGAFSVSRNLERELPVLLHSLRADRRRVAGMAGVVVIGVPDERWRKAVLMTMARCALVIIDLSDPSENLEWELSTAVTTLSPERVVIACARTDQLSEDVARHVIGQTLLRAVAPELVSRFRVFFYPEGLGKSRLLYRRMSSGASCR